MARIAKEAMKLGNPLVPILVTHLKPQYREEIIKELKKIKGHRLKILKEGESIQM